jgi:drug/metabolite transporter (DMT)-like permease
MTDSQLETPTTTRRLSGVLLMLGSAAAFSTIGLFTALIRLPLAEVLLIRGVAGAIAIWFVARIFTRQRFLSRENLRWPSVAVAVLFTVGMTTLVGAYRIGSVINVSVVYATIPMVVGIAELLLFKRRPPPIFWLCGLGVIVGIALMSSHGGVTPSDIVAMGLAFTMTLCVTAIILIARAHQDTPMLAASGAACLLSSVIAAPFIDTFVIDARQLWLSVLFGVVTLGLGRVFLVLGSSRVPSRDAALIDVLDAPMTPIWTLVFLSDVPPVLAVVGGLVVITSVLVGVRSDPET